MLLTTTLHQASDGRWSWSVLNRHQQSVGRGEGYATQEEAALAAASGQRTIRRVMAGELRDDGEPMTGYADVDNDIAAPSNILDV